MAAIFSAVSTNAQKIRFENKDLEPVNVKALIVDKDGNKVLSVQRDLNKRAFNPDKMVESIDGPIFVKLSDTVFENGTIEVEVLSEITENSPFPQARGGLLIVIILISKLFI